MKLSLKEYAKTNKLQYQALLALLHKQDTATDHRGVVIRAARGGADEEDANGDSVSHLLSVVFVLLFMSTCI